MIPYEFYKVLHFLSLFIFLLSSAVLLLKDTKCRTYKIISGVSAFFVFLAGMGLSARLGHGLQTWMIIKIVILFLLTGFLHMAAKRMPNKGLKVLWVIVIGMSIAACLAVYKPF